MLAKEIVVVEALVTHKCLKITNKMVAYNKK
jgi:hypothetical protein